MLIPDASVPRKQGRPHGAANYSGASLIAKEMKIRGVDWKAEVVEAFKRAKETNDFGMLDRMISLLPYITTTQSERITARNKRPERKARVTEAAVERLMQAENR